MQERNTRICDKNVRVSEHYFFLTGRSKTLITPIQEEAKEQKPDEEGGIGKVGR
jgi:hypothetical protein